MFYECFKKLGVYLITAFSSISQIILNCLEGGDFDIFSASRFSHVAQTKSRVIQNTNTDE